MITPSEIIYWEILPAIRKELVVSLKELGLKQKEIADILNVTPSAISQYLKKKRGSFKFENSFKTEIKKTAKVIAKEKKDVFEETNKLIRKFEQDKHICGVCSEKNQIKKGCNVCF